MVPELTPGSEVTAAALYLVIGMVLHLGCGILYRLIR